MEVRNSMVIDKPKLNKPTPEENIALLDKWVSETADKLNIFITQIEKERSDNDGK